MKRKFSSSRFLILVQIVLWGWLILSFLSALPNLKIDLDNNWLLSKCPVTKSALSDQVSHECSKYGGSIAIKGLEDADAAGVNLFEYGTRSYHWECYRSYEDYLNFINSLDKTILCTQAQNDLKHIFAPAILAVLTFYTILLLAKYLFPKQKVKSET